MPPGMGLGGALEFDLVFQAVDNATGVLQAIGRELESVITQAADFQSTLTQVQNNTTMTTADVAAMRAAVLSLNAQSGAPLDQLAAGFMHIENVGYTAAEAIKILTAANESAVSTGSDTADVANVLGLQMHEFGLRADEAGRAMNVLHLAAAEGNATLEQFVTQTSKATAMAANLGIPITQVDAALAALSRHMDLSQANTALAGEFSKLVNPAAATVKELKHLSDVTGIDLVHDFTYAGMSAKGFPAVMEDLRKATGGNVTEMLKLIPAMRGGLAEMVLLGTGSADYSRILKDLTDTMAGKTDPTTQAYQRTLNTFNRQVAIVGADFQQLLMTIGQPIIDTLSPYLHDLIDWMNKHKADIDAFGHAIGTGVGGAISAFVKNVPHMFSAVQGEWQKFVDLTSTVGGYFDTLGTNLHNTLVHVVGDLYNVGEGLTQGIDQSVNVLIAGINKALTATYGLTHGGAALPKDQAVPTLQMDTAAEMTANRERFLDSVFGPGWRQLGRPGGGGGIDGVRGTPPAPPPVPQGGAGAGGGHGAGRSGAGQENPYAGMGADAAGYQDAMATQAAQRAAVAAAQQVVAEAQRQFAIDQLRGAARPTLLRDIGAILTDMGAPALGNTPRAIELEHLQLLQAISQHTKTTATHAATLAGAPGGIYQRPDAAGYGATIASFGMARPDSQQQVINRLERMIGTLQHQLDATREQNTILREELGHSRQAAQATTLTAGYTGRILGEMGKPTQWRDPRGRLGLVTARGG